MTIRGQGSWFRVLDTYSNQSKWWNIWGGSKVHRMTIRGQGSWFRVLDTYSNQSKWWNIWGGSTVHRIYAVRLLTVVGRLAIYCNDN